MPLFERNNNSTSDQTFGRISSGLWSQYEFVSNRRSAIIGRYRNRARSLCEPYTIELIDSKLAQIYRPSALRKYPSLENLQSVKANTHDCDSDKENASSFPIAKSQIVEKCMALNESTENLQSAENRTVAGTPDTNLNPCNFDQGLSVSTTTTAIYGIDDGNDSDVSKEIKANTEDATESSPAAWAATIPNVLDAHQDVSDDDGDDSGANKCIVHQQKRKISQLRRCSIELDRLDVKLELLKSQANALE